MSELIKSVKQFVSGNHERIGRSRHPRQQSHANHLKSVAQLVSASTDDENAIAAAWLHDIVEDTAVTVGDVERRFGSAVAALVNELSSAGHPMNGNDTARFEVELRHMAGASSSAKIIKLADLLDTCRDLQKAGAPEFPNYAATALRMLPILKDGDARISNRLKDFLGKHAPVEVGLEAKPQPPRPLAHSLSALRVFEHAFSAQDVAEPLLSFDFEQNARRVSSAMAAANISVAAVRRDGLVRGYVEASGLGDGTCGDFLRGIQAGQLVGAKASLSDVIEVLTLHDWCFVSILGEPSGVITRADMRKPAVRMWLFGIVTVAEMEFTERVRQKWPADKWVPLLSPSRVEKARQLLVERERRHESCTLLDCLQLGDKLDILVSDPTEFATFGLSTTGAAKRISKQLENLRNKLAHSQDLSDGDWAQIVRLSRRIDSLIRQL